MSERPQELLQRYDAWERNTDKYDFQWRLRLLQSLWRVKEGLGTGELKGKARGAQLAMPMAKHTLLNYLTPNIRDVVRRELNKPSDKLYKPPRIYDSLLSSQPLCFNLFGELTFDLDLATRALADMSDGRIAKVLHICFEFSPGRGDKRYTGDRSAFDVYIQYATRSGGRGFAGVEVKYHENLEGGKEEEKHYRNHCGRYNEIAETMRCFRDLDRLRGTWLQQIWRDHLLMGAHKHEDGFEDALFVFLYPKANTRCEEAAREYTEYLTDDSSFCRWTLEDLAGALMAHSSAEWIRTFYRRYLDFSRLDDILRAQ